MENFLYDGDGVTLSPKRAARQLTKGLSNEDCRALLSAYEYHPPGPARTPRGGLIGVSVRIPGGYGNTEFVRVTGNATLAGLLDRMQRGDLSIAKDEMPEAYTPAASYDASYDYADRAEV